MPAVPDAQCQLLGDVQQRLGTSARARTVTDAIPETSVFSVSAAAEHTMQHCSQDVETYDPSCAAVHKNVVILHMCKAAHSSAVLDVCREADTEGCCLCCCIKHMSAARFFLWAH
jgi:hypothetical protein